MTVAPTATLTPVTVQVVWDVALLELAAALARWAGEPNDRPYESVVGHGPGGRDIVADVAGGDRSGQVLGGSGRTGRQATERDERGPDANHPKRDDGQDLEFHGRLQAGHCEPAPAQRSNPH